MTVLHLESSVPVKHTEVIISDNEMAVQNEDETAVSSAEQTRKPTTNRARVIANQLQFVCHQLRSETKNLEVLYNTIMFISPKADTFSLSMESLPLVFRNHSHIFFLKAPLEQWKPNDFGDLIKFCRAYPQCTLNFHHPNLILSKPIPTIFTALLVKHGARKYISFLEKVTKDPFIQQKIMQTLPAKVQGQLVALVPPNLTFYPYDDFEESTLRKACAENNIIRNLLAPTLSSGLDDLIAVGKDCYINGF